MEKSVGIRSFEGSFMKDLAASLGCATDEAIEGVGVNNINNYVQRMKDDRVGVVCERASQTSALVNCGQA